MHKLLKIKIIKALITIFCQQMKKKKLKKKEEAERIEVHLQQLHKEIKKFKK